MGIFDKLDALQAAQNPQPVAPEEDGSFTRGMRSGATAAGGQLRALAAGVGEAVGAKDFAKEQYAKSAEAAALAQQQAPAINSWQQVTNAPDLSTGLRNAGSYVAGLAGQAVPMIGAGAAAAGATALTGGGALAALGAGTAAIAPFETGGALQRQQQDPAALANNSAGMRLATAALEGTGRSLAMNAVPQFMGGRLLGAAEKGAARSLPAAVGENLAEGMGGNALAGAAAEKISTTAEGALNPNRDTSGDNDRMIDAAVSGAALGVPFAGMGLAGHVLHGEAPTARTDGIKPGGATPAAPDGTGGAVETAPVPTPSMQDRVRSLFAKGEDAAKDIAADKDLIDPEALKNMPPEQQGEALKAADADREQKARSWTQELLDGDKLSPENRAALVEKAGDLSNRATQTFVAGLKVATDTGSKVLNAATEFYDALSKKKDDGAAPATPEGIQLSTIGAGAEKAIADVVAPHIDAKYPDLMRSDAGKKAVTGTLRRAMDDMQTTGKLDDGMAEHLHSWFGDDTPSVLADLHDKVMGQDAPPSATNRYFAAINDMTDAAGQRGALADKVKAALKPELQDSATPESINSAVKLMREYADGAHLDGLSPEQARFKSQQIENAMREHFGNNTDKLIGAFAKDAKDRASTHDDMLANTDAVKVSDKDALDEGGFADTPEAGITEATDQIHYGGGNDKQNPTFVLSEKAHNAQFSGEGQASRLLRQARAEHPDMNVSTVPAAIYAREQGWGKQQLMDATNGKPDDHVMIRAEGVKRDGLSMKDMEAMKNDSHNYPDSPSRIETDSGLTLDAVKVLKHYAPESRLPRNDTDAISPYHRAARQFKEAIAQISDNLGEDVHVPDDTVVMRGKGGKTTTWGELQALSKIKAEPGETARNAEREAAVKAGDKDTVAKLDAKERNRVLADEQHEAEPGAASKQIADLARQLGSVKERAAAEADKRGPLRGADGKQLRPMSMVERGLAREYSKLADRYEATQGRRGEGGEVHSEDGGVRKAGDGEGDFKSFTNMESASWGGASEIAPDGQIHLATEQHGDTLGSRVAASRSMEAGKEGNMLHADNFSRPNPYSTEMHPDVVSGIGSKISKLENGAPATWRAIGAKARSLYDLMQNGGMKVGDQALMASIIKDGKVSSIADTINALHAKYDKALNPQAGFATDAKSVRALQGFVDKINEAAGSSLSKGDLKARFEKTPDLKQLAAKLNVPVETLKGLDKLYQDPAAKKPSAFVERVLAGGDDFNKTVKQIKGSSDVAGLRRAVDALIPHQGDMRADTVLGHANERIEALMKKDPTIAYNMQRAGAKTIDPVTQGDIAKHIDKVLGGAVDLEFKKMLHAGEFERGTAGARDVIRVSVHSLDPMGTAYHESLHALMSKLSDASLGEKAHPLFRAAMGEHVQAQLRALLHGEPDALRQLSDPHEAAAYMYQFYERGALNVHGKPKSIIEKIGNFLKSAMGMWTNDQRAEHIMDYFSSGEYANNMGDRNAVSRALEKRSSLKLGLAERAAQFKQFVGPLDTLAARIALTGDANVRGFNNEHLTKILDHVYSPMQGAHDDAGYMPAARAKRTQVLNELATDLQKIDSATVTDALTSMQRGEKGSTPAERQVITRVRSMLDQMHGYMAEAKVNVNDLGVGKDYFPRVWDTQKILANEPAFREMMQHYIDKGDFKGSVDQVIATLTRSDGSDLQVETAKPGMQYARERVLHFIAGRDAEPFLNKNMYQTLNSYVSQATRRAEWARRFGDDGATLKSLFESARKAGATDEQVATTMNYLKSVDGTLGDSIDPKLRRAFGNAIVYQNIRILPMMIFSSLIDSGGIMVRGGKVSEAFSTFKRGFSEIPEGFKKVGNQKHDAATQLAETMGTIDSAVLMHTLGSSYSQGMTSDLGRRVNDTLFKYNLAEQYNRSMRVGATEAAVAFLGRHADGTESIHSKRWLAELGFKPGEIKTDATGRPLLHADQFEAAGMAPDKAQAAADRMAIAVNKWVDGAILRPNAAHKPMWMSDPHFALVAHLKQFVYSFQETILKRVVNEAKHGNVGPAYSLAAYVPFMLAADMAKGALLNGGGVPAQRANWDATDYLGYELQRAGLFGVGQFAIDAAKDIHRGGMGIGALSGPTLEQLGEAARTVGGTEQFKTFALNSMPANQLYDAVDSAATNAVD